MKGKRLSRFTKVCMSCAALMLLCVLVSTTSTYFAGKKPAASLNPPPWPTWAHEHWVWENEGTQESAMSHVKGFLERDIPVGAMIIDRPWSTDVNTFVPDPERYPDLAEQIQLYHDMDVRVILWATSVMNDSSPLYEEGKELGYFLNEGKKVKWWAGESGFIDYTNPEAVEWWHKQMDTVLDMGIDGWKVDGTDPYMMLLTPAKGKGDKNITWAEYRAQCYGDFFHYTRSKLGDDRVISARPVDDQLLKIGTPLVFTTPDINFAGWVGDNDNDWKGLQHALTSIFASSRYDFVSYGSDIGGFRSDDKMYKDVFLRWTQLGAFSPVMENGGGGEHRPWMFDEQTLDIYRKFVKLHTELIPYLYSQAAYSYELQKPTMRPQPGKFTYMLGDELLVAPFYEAGNSRKIVFPKGEWIYLFDEAKTYNSGVKTLDIPLDEAPVFIRKGAILPMNVTSDATGHGTEHSAAYTTVLLYPKDGENSFGLYEEGGKGSMLSYTKDSKTLTVRSTESKRSLLLRIHGEAEPASVTLAGAPLQKAASMEELTRLGAGYFTENGINWIAVKDVSAGATITVNS